MWKIIALPVATAALAVPVMAQAPVRSERVQFPRGASSITVRGTVRGYDSVDYAIGARGGQTMTVSLRTTNRSAFFNLLPPRGKDAIFNGSIKGSRFDGRLSQSGDYRVRVYLMRNAARRGETASFTLNIGVGGRPGGPGAGPGGSGPPSRRATRRRFAGAKRRRTMACGRPISRLDARLPTVRAVAR